MLYYKYKFNAEGDSQREMMYKFKNNGDSQPAFKNEERRTTRDIASNIDMQLAESNGEHAFCIVEADHNSIIVVGIFGFMLLDNDVHIHKAALVASLCGKKATLISYKEVTEKECVTMIHTAYKRNFLSDIRSVNEQFELDGDAAHGIDLVGRELLADEQISKAEASKRARMLNCDNTLRPEIERIYESDVKRFRSGHPVHYFISTSVMALTEIALGLLVSMLHTKKRIVSCRYTILTTSNRLDRDDVRALYKKSEGGTVVLMSDSKCNDDDEYAGPEERNINFVCEMAKKHANRVLTIVCVDITANKLIHKFREELADLAFIDICEDAMDEKKARAYLGSLAKKNEVSAKKEMFDGISGLDSLCVKSLNKYFDKWYSKYLLTHEYPQYSMAAKKIEVKEKPKGNAYAEIESMIGLEAAKKTLISAIDYFKAQRVFAEYDAFEGRPSMHMVFTGDPGTAKTTVARLFTKIMYDNKLLATGEFIEVGRSDLVGQYVGWTAPSVKKKFQQAKGGVLFIDEAYSLVDDRKGQYGDEAINTIVQEMENMRDDIVVIFAGYPDEMKGFLDRNPGLSSRIAFHVNFPNYSPEELLKIAELIAQGKKRKLSESAKAALTADFEYAISERSFGNGRYVRNLIEKALMNQATRLLRTGYDKVSMNEIAVLEEEDFALKLGEKDAKSAVIGFK